MNNILSAIGAFLLIGIGVIGVVMPLLPGVPLAWLGLFGYGYATGFKTVSLNWIFLFLGLAILTLVLDVLAPAAGTRSQKASRCSVIGAILGGMFGIFIFGPVGIIAGPVLGAFLGEISSTRDVRRGIASAWGALIGFIFGSIFKLAIILAMIVYLISSFFR